MKIKLVRSCGIPVNKVANAGDTVDVPADVGVRLLKLRRGVLVEDEPVKTRVVDSAAEPVRRLSVLPGAKARKK